MICYDVFKLPIIRFSNGLFIPAPCHLPSPNALQLGSKDNTCIFLHEKGDNTCSLEMHLKNFNPSTYPALICIGMIYKVLQRLKLDICQFTEKSSL